MVQDKIAAYFGIEQKSVGTRFNWYRDSSDWKPFHHDSAAFNAQRARNQNITVGVSFGATRELAFLHAKNGTKVLCLFSVSLLSSYFFFFFLCLLPLSSFSSLSSSAYVFLFVPFVLPLTISSLSISVVFHLQLILCKHIQMFIQVYFPQTNGMMFSFGRDTNILWKHGVNALPETGNPNWPPHALLLFFFLFFFFFFFFYNYYYYFYYYYYYFYYYYYYFYYYYYYYYYYYFYYNFYYYYLFYKFS
jgi:hypothetical protein